MPLAAADFKLATSHVPTLVGEDVFYCGHPSARCKVYVWRPDGWDTVGFTDRPCLVLLHHGFGHNPGDRASEPSSFGGMFGDLCATLHARGWCIISLDYPPAPSNLSTDREFIGMEFWLAQYLTALRGIAWIRSVAKPLETDRSKVALEAATIHRTLFGVDSLGRVNTIDPNMIGVGGRSHGGLLAMFAAWFPSALFRKFLAPGALSHDYLELRASHKPTFVISAIGQALWTNFHVDTGTTNPLGDIYWNDIHQQFARKLGGDKWSEVPMWQKAAASPYFYLVAGYAENRTIPVYANWGATNANNGAALTVADNDPYKVLDDVAGNRAFWDPHAPIPQAKMVEDAIKAGFGDPRSRIVWGNTANNPGGANNDNVPVDYLDAADWILETFGV
jgi:hypothetical protein